MIRKIRTPLFSLALTEGDIGTNELILTVVAVLQVAELRVAN